MPTSVSRPLLAAAALATLGLGPGCQTTDALDRETSDANYVSEYEWRDPPIGSHMKRRVRRGTPPAEHGVTRPAMGGKVTDETDTLTHPLPAGEILGTGRPPGG